MNGLDKIIEKIAASGRAEAAEIITEAEKEAAEIKKTAEAEAAEIMKNAAASSDGECAAIRARAISSASSMKRSALLGAKAAAVNEAYKSALDALVKLPEEAYRELMVELLTDALKARVSAWHESSELYGDEAEIPDTAELIMNANDREKVGKVILKDMRKAIDPDNDSEYAKIVKQLKLSDQTAEIKGGFILVTGDIETNCSLALLMERLRDSLDSEVYGVLFPPKKETDK